MSGVTINQSRRERDLRLAGSVVCRGSFGRDTAYCHEDRCGGSRPTSVKIEEGKIPTVGQIAIIFNENKGAGFLIFALQLTDPKPFSIVLLGLGEVAEWSKAALC